jgi:hypothetical protein
MSSPSRLGQNREHFSLDSRRPASVVLISRRQPADWRPPEVVCVLSRRLGLDAIGEPAQDGVPEPPQFALNDGVRLMRVPTGGFGWVIGDREVARAGLLSWRGV